jgi:hypothetical protein
MMNQDITTCPTCQHPTHATESNDDGVCVECLGNSAILPADEITADTITDEQIRELRATCAPFPLDGSTIDVTCDMALGVYPTPPWLTEEDGQRDRLAARARCAAILDARGTK